MHIPLLDNGLPYCIRSHTVNRCPFHDVLSAMLFALLCFLLILLCRMVPKQSAEALCSVSKHKKAVMCLMEKILLDKLCSGMK